MTRTRWGGFKVVDEAAKRYSDTLALFVPAHSASVLDVSTQPFVLFVPYYGRGGSGEFVRSVTLAQAVARRWPETRIEFLLPGGPGTRQDAPFPNTCHDGPDDQKGAFDSEHVARLRPDLVVFDCGGRSESLRTCKRLGITSAYISDRDGTLKKPFRLDWMWLLDEHWHQREHVTADSLLPSQRWRSRFSRTRRLFFDTYYAEDEADWSSLAPALRQLLEVPFVLLSPGGGGYTVDGDPVSEVFVRVAERVHAETGLACLTLLGPLYQGHMRSATTHVATTLPQPLFREFVRRAQLVLTNGGHSLHQALAMRATCVVAPLGGSDQPARIAAYDRAGLVVKAEPNVDALGDAALALLVDPAARRAMADRLAALHIVNGIPLMRDRIGSLLGMSA